MPTEDPEESDDGFERLRFVIKFLIYSFFANPSKIILTWPLLILAGLPVN